jgi:L-alanine-DL-glutamate epimerase-like enolase superfamily enzyme
MQIAAIRTVLLSHRCSGDPPLVWVGGRIETWDAALVEVTLKDGTTGVGEVGQGIMAAIAVPGLVDAFAPYVLGTELQPLEVGDHLRARSRFWAHGGIPSGVIGAIETACLDASAKQANEPLWRYLGGDPGETVRAYASGGLGTTYDGVASWVEAQAASGFDQVKIRAMRDPETTIGLVKEVTAQAPHGLAFALDAVQACASHPWSHEDAIRVGNIASDLGAVWFEEPCAVEDVPGYARVRRGVATNVSGVESYTLVEQFDRLTAADGVDIVQPDLTMVGGPVALGRVAAMARERGVRCVPHIWGSGVQLSASVHVALANGVDLIEMCTLENPLRAALQLQPFAIEAGRIRRPDLPGIGVELTPEIEAQYPFIPGLGHVIT